MKKKLLLLFILSAFFMNAQHTISGTFSPAEDYPWLLAYKLSRGTQNYVSDAQIIDGEFSLKLPENSTPGTYRLVYAIPQNEFYFDVIYNGKEDISLAFSTENGIVYKTSEENILFNAYLKDFGSIEQQIVSFYASGSEDKTQFLNLIKELKHIQLTYEKNSADLVANTFIRSNTPYIPEGYEPIEVYITHRKDTYFSSLNIGDSLLQESGFLIDKLTNYVFTALPLEPMNQPQIEEAILENFQTVNELLKNSDGIYKMNLYYSLWAQAVKQGLVKTSDYVYLNALKPLALENANNVIIENIELHNRLRKGALAPEIIWQSGKEMNKLSSLEASENYLLVFWSSSCSHCLNELPKLHSGLKGNNAILVLAVGLEDDDINWKVEAAKLPDFNHAISFGKWESEYAILYAIEQTPTYYLLDKNKRIIEQFKDYEAVLAHLSKNTGQQ